MSDYEWIVTNTRHDKQWAADTETKGRVVSGKTRYLATKNEELVAELKAKDPFILATPTVDPRLHGRVSVTVPQLPYETEWDRKHKK